MARLFDFLGLSAGLPGVHANNDMLYFSAQMPTLELENAAIYFNDIGFESKKQFSIDTHIDDICCCGSCGNTFDALDKFGIADQSETQNSIPGDTTTTATITVGTPQQNVIDFSGDTDWFEVTLTAGQTYEFLVAGAAHSGNPKLTDALVSLYNADGELLGTDDDGGSHINALRPPDGLLTFTASETGTFYVEADGFGTATGGYTISVNTRASDTVANGPGTNASHTIGTSTTGEVDYNADQDWFAVELVAGETYEFLLDIDGSNTLPDGYLSLHDENGVVLSINDDVDVNNLGSRIVWTAESSGTYFLSAQGFTGNDEVSTGTYTLRSGFTDPLSPFDALDWGSQLADTTVDVYFAAAGETFDGTTSLGWSQFELDAVMAALNEISESVDLTFVVTTNSADAEFKLLTYDFTADSDPDNDTTLGFFGPPDTGPGTGVGVFGRTADGWSQAGLQKGGFGYVTLIHEFAHGLGLAHPHDTGGASSILRGVTSSSDTGLFDLNQGVYTTLSYIDGWETAPHGASTFLSFGYQATMMAFDLALLQQKYGAVDRNNGDTVYSLPDTNSAGTFYELIWDTGGTDTLHYGGSRDTVIDLREATLHYDAGGGGYVSYAADIHGGFTIANGVDIENAVGGAGNDLLTGNSQDNDLKGNDGNDVIDGGSGNDTINGGSGNDELSGGLGNDNILGGLGEDQIFGGNSIDYLSGGSDDDYVAGGGNSDTVLGGGGNDVLLGMSGNDIIDGHGGNDDISGGEGSDTAYGGGGNDVINGGNGADTLFGDTGNDTISGNAGSDTLYGGSGEDNLTGGGNADTLFGGDGHDRLSGGRGGDELTGGAGNDELIGGDGTDTAFFSGAFADYTISRVSGTQFTITHNNSGSDGTDTLKFVEFAEFSDRRVTLINPDNETTFTEGPDNVFGTDEADLFFALGGDDIVSGGAGDDVIFGEGGDDELFGDDGDDAISGGLGQDRIQGGAGSDTLNGEDDDDNIRGGVGNDVVSGGFGADMLFGEGGDDTLEGNDGDDIIDGGGANDTIDGGAGNDELIGNSGEDNIVGGDGNDQIFGGDGIDILDGGADDDYIEGAGNGDTISGGDGDDILLGMAGSDTINGGNGNDDISTGHNADTANGGAGDDKIHGGNGDDILHGDDGNDNLSGSFGRDTLFGDAGDDFLAGGGNTDVLFGGDGNDRLTGGRGDDQLVGGNGNDNINGGSDGDTLFGNDGDDLLKGDTGGDLLNGGEGADTLTGGEGIDVFVFSQGDSLVGATDFITDMEAGEIIALSTHAFVADGAFSSTGQFEVRYISGPTTLLEFDNNGDGVADEIVEIAGNFSFTSDGEQLTAVLVSPEEPDLFG